MKNLIQFYAIILFYNVLSVLKKTLKKKLNHSLQFINKKIKMHAKTKRFFENVVFDFFCHRKAFRNKTN